MKTPPSSVTNKHQLPVPGIDTTIDNNDGVPVSPRWTREEKRQKTPEKKKKKQVRDRGARRPDFQRDDDHRHGDEDDDNDRGDEYAECLHVVMQDRIHLRDDDDDDVDVDGCQAQNERIAQEKEQQQQEEEEEEGGCDGWSASSCCCGITRLQFPKELFAWMVLPYCTRTDLNRLGATNKRNRRIVDDPVLVTKPWPSSRCPFLVPAPPPSSATTTISPPPTRPLPTTNFQPGSTPGQERAGPMEGGGGGTALLLTQAPDANAATRDDSDRTADDPTTPVGEDENHRRYVCFVEFTPMDLARIAVSVQKHPAIPPYKLEVWDRNVGKMIELGCDPYRSFKPIFASNHRVLVCSPRRVDRNAMDHYTEDILVVQFLSSSVHPQTLTTTTTTTANSPTNHMMDEEEKKETDSHARQEGQHHQLLSSLSSPTSSSRRRIHVSGHRIPNVDGATRIHSVCMLDDDTIAFTDVNSATIQSCRFVYDGDDDDDEEGLDHPNTPQGPDAVSDSSNHSETCINSREDRLVVGLTDPEIVTSIPFFDDESAAANGADVVAGGGGGTTTGGWRRCRVKSVYTNERNSITINSNNKKKKRQLLAFVNDDVEEDSNPHCAEIVLYDPIRKTTIRQSLLPPPSVRPRLPSPPASASSAPRSQLPIVDFAFSNDGRWLVVSQLGGILSLLDCSAERIENIGHPQYILVPAPMDDNATSNVSSSNTVPTVPHSEHDGLFYYGMYFLPKRKTTTTVNDDDDGDEVEHPTKNTTIFTFYGRSQETGVRIIDLQSSTIVAEGWDDCWTILSTH